MRWGLTTSILLVLVGCGKVDPADFDTVPPITTAVPPPGAFAIAPTAVNLVSNEATTIYYTTDGTEPTLASTAAASPLAIRTITDGTTITFFAVDEAGNQEVVQRATYSFDGAGPGPVTGLSATEDASNDVTVRWTNPTDPDFAAVVVTRGIRGDTPFAPSVGMRFAVGDEVAPGEQVIYVGADTSLVDAEAVPGFNLYSVHPVDAAGNYGARAGVYGTNSFAETRVASLSVQLSPLPAVTVTTQPQLLGVTASADFDFAAQRLTVHLTLDNKSARVLHSPKVVVDTISQGVLGNATATLQGRRYLAFGPAGLGAQRQATRDLVFTGVTGAMDPIQLDLRIETSPMLVLGVSNFLRLGDAVPTARLTDGAPITPQVQLPCANGIAGGCNYTEGVFTRDGRRLLIGDGRRAAVVAIDTTDLTVGGSDELSRRGFVDSVALSPDGQTVYAVYNDNVHRQLNGGPPGPGNQGASLLGSPSNVQLVELDAFSLRERRRLEVVTASTGGRDTRVRGHRLTLSADGTRGALALKNAEEVLHLDLTSLTVLRRVPVESGSVNGRVRYGVLSPDGARIFVAYRGVPGRLDVIDTSTYAITPLPLTAPAVSANPGDLIFGPTGRLYFSRKNVAAGEASLIILNLTTMTQTPRLNGGRIMGLDFSPDGAIAYAADGNAGVVRAFSTTTDQEVDTDGVAGNGLTAIPAGIARAHTLVVSPL